MMNENQSSGVNVVDLLDQLIRWTEFQDRLNKDLSLRDNPDALAELFRGKSRLTSEQIEFIWLGLKLGLHLSPTNTDENEKPSDSTDDIDDNQEPVSQESGNDEQSNHSQIDEHTGNQDDVPERSSSSLGKQQVEKYEKNQSYGQQSRGSNVETSSGLDKTLQIAKTKVKEFWGGGSKQPSPDYFSRYLLLVGSKKEIDSILDTGFDYKKSISQEQLKQLIAGARFMKGYEKKEEAISVKNQFKDGNDLPDDRVNYMALIIEVSGAVIPSQNKDALLEATTAFAFEQGLEPTKPAKFLEYRKLASIEGVSAALHRLV